MRQIARSIAREVMKRSGMKKINKKRPELGGRSYFAINWREAAKYTLAHPNKVYAGSKGIRGKPIICDFWWYGYDISSLSASLVDNDEK